MRHFLRCLLISLSCSLPYSLPQAGVCLRAAPAPLPRREVRGAPRVYDLTYCGVRWKVNLYHDGRYESFDDRKVCDFVGVWWMEGGYLYVKERPTAQKSYDYVRTWGVWMPADGETYDGTGSYRCYGTDWNNVAVAIRKVR